MHAATPGTPSWPKLDASQASVATAIYDRSVFRGNGITQWRSLLVPAYDDRQGVTAAFNLNLLKRLNRECGADFDLSAFQHRAVWNAAKSRVEMHLVSQRRQTVTIGERAFLFDAGETIHTENSHKYTPQSLVEIAATAGWALEDAWVGADPVPTQAQAATFGMFLLRAL